METPLVRNDIKFRRAALKHVKRRLTIDLEKAPSEETEQAPKPTGDSATKTGKKMPRCYSLSELDTRKGYRSPVNGLVVPYLETSGELHPIPRELLHISLDESKRIHAVCVSREHNYSSHSVKMKFGGKFGSLKKTVEDDKVDNHKNAKTSGHVTKNHDKKERDIFSSAGQKKLKGTVCEALAMNSTCMKAEQKFVEMDGNVNLEECWLSASFPPPSLSGFSTFLQGRTSRGTPHPGSSRPSSVVSIGELDRWLFPGDNASPTVAGGQAVKTVSTPWVLSPTVTTLYSSPPKLTTKASPAGVALASPKPVLPQTNPHLYLSPHHSIRGANVCLEPLFTSTPKSPKTGSIKYINSDLIGTQSDSQSGMESVSYSGDNTTPCQPIPYPQDIHEDLGRLKPLDGTPIELQSVPAVMLQGVDRDQPDTGHPCSTMTSVQRFPHPSSFIDELTRTVVSTSSSQTSTLPPYLMCSTTAVAASRVADSSPHLLHKSSVNPAYICSSGHGLVHKHQIGPTAVQRPTDLPIGDSTKDNTSSVSPPFILQAPVVQLQTVPPSGEMIEVPTELSKPHPCLQSLPQSPKSKPKISSGLCTGLFKVWVSPTYSMQQSSRIPQSPQLTYTSNGTPYIAHARPCAGNHKLPETSCAGCGPPLKVYPRTLANTWDRSPLGVPHPLEVDHGPAPGGLPRFTIQSNPKSDTKGCGRGPLGVPYPLAVDHGPALAFPRFTVQNNSITDTNEQAGGSVAVPYPLQMDHEPVPRGVPRYTVQRNPTPDTNKRGRGPLGVPYPLQMDHGPAPGGFPRFTVERIPTPDTNLTNRHRPSWVSHVNDMNAQGACCTSNAVVPVPHHPPLTIPCPIAESVSVSSDSIPASRQINCHHVITSG